ncbi:SDR family NAD(P)-dependent oxidoreductase [Halomarina litorea]|uniref:SDR family NAD(P)-dependent oxidoreductase n=1 Tax=Halomarina litorea TaxID=2961595 RepID=UPI0020C4C990|nr:SDR family NAD(P)-dependent oxidoreductase [Halomarina sp. BCD28]
MPTYDFEGKVAFVTGAARGQGRSHAVEFAKSGADVAVGDLRTDGGLAETAELVEAEGQESLALEVDVSQLEAVRRAVDRIEDRFGQIDILVNNAGVWEVADPFEVDESTWDRTLDVNLKGAWLCAAEVANRMAEQSSGGAIVNISSVAGLVGFPGSVHYSASKHGIVGLTKTMAIEYASHGINVNAVCPGSVNTQMMRQGLADAQAQDTPPDFTGIAGSFNLFDEEDNPLTERDISEAVLWLSSEASKYVTGVTLPVDAGFSAK